jgi:hypothetical protein
MSALEEFLVSFFGVLPSNASDPQLAEHDRELAKRVAGMTIAAVVLDVREIKTEPASMTTPPGLTFDERYLFSCGYVAAIDRVITKLGAKP